MKSFTDYREEWIDSFISSHMKLICQEILKIIKRVDSIILVGGFGRGEGSIKIIKNQELIPIKDYDLIVVSNHKISGNNYIKLISNIHKVLKIPTDWYYKAAPGHFHVNIKLIKKKRLARLPPDISNFELKNSSRLIYGSDVRQLIPIRSEDITYSSGLRVLLNKVIGLLENFPKSLSLFRKNPFLTESCIYECGKVYLEIATALTILMRCYDATYKERAINFEKNYYRLPFLTEKFPKLNVKIKKFTRLKLRPEFNELNLEPIKLWHSTSDDLINILMYYFELITFNKAGDPSKFMKKFPKFLELHYFYPYIDYYLKKFSLNNKFLVNFGSLLLQIYENFAYMRNHKQFFTLRNIFSKQSPIIKIYSAALSTLFSIKNTNNKSFFIKNAFKSLKNIYPLKNQHENIESQIDTLRKACINTHKLYELKRISKSTF
ncbi:MAG: hypothetical protein ACFFDN_22280 [Candidatus Hodarchaeota archaeon]